MKKIGRTLMMSGLLASQLIFAGSCDEKIIPQEQVKEEITNNLTAELSAKELMNSFVTTPELNEEEKVMLNFMKEEEKLARDVYYALAEVWTIPVFTNISKSEERHIAAVMRLVEFYNLGSTQVKTPGIFEDETFQNLYNQLVEQGKQSIEEAMKVGALIEELDIKDLKEKLEKTKNENITLVFNNLLRGSGNHLRAFNRQLVRYGIEYKPQFITTEEFDDIINSIK